MPSRSAHTNTRSHRAPSRKPSAADMDAIALLKADHKAVSDLFKQYGKAGDDQKKKADLAGEICQELTLHATVEEEIFYPQAREALGEDEKGACLLNEAEVEHGSVKVLIAQIEEALDAGSLDEKTDAQVMVLGEYVKHHVKEEESELFRKIRKSDMDLDEVADLLRERKEELKLK